MIGGLPADAMHDVLEGVLQYIVKELLKVYIIQKKYFRLEDLNRRIAVFDFGSQVKKILKQHGMYINV